MTCLFIWSGSSYDHSTIQYLHAIMIKDYKADDITVVVHNRKDEQPPPDYKDVIAETQQPPVVLEDSHFKKRQIAKAEYQRGFAENHYITWMVIRCALMGAGIVFSCRKARHIRCHGHGGSCGKYHQDRECRGKAYQDRGGCCVHDRDYSRLSERRCGRRRSYCWCAIAYTIL